MSGSGDRPADDYAFDPTGGELADVARRGAREWERDMAAWEADAEQLRLKGRSLSDVLWEAMQRGDRVTVVVAGHTLTGLLGAARGDLALLDTADTRVAVNVSAVETVSLQRGGDGVAGDRTYGSLRAYLGMLEVEQPPVRILGRDFEVAGRIAVVAADHVLVAVGSGGESVVSTASIGAVVVESN